MLYGCSVKKLGNIGAAARAGVKPGTWRSYVARGQAPEPDGYEEVSGTPWWWPTTIDFWLVNRPGPGTRTDLT
jgi:hypothetical protein